MPINPAMLSPDVQDYIRKHAHDDLHKLLLGKSPFAGVSMKALMEQLSGLSKSKDKLPLWHQTPGVVFPKEVAVEQCSSEATARFKASLVEGATFADISSGFGVDAYFLSQRFAQGISVEPDSDLMDVQQHNHQVLGCHNLTYVQQTASDFLEHSPGAYDWIFIDPSRRKGARRLTRLEEYEPDPVALLPALFRCAPNLLIKASPLQDISSGIAALRGVREVIAVELRGECRELLFLLERSYSGEAEIEACVLDTAYNFRFRKSEETSASVTHSDPMEFLYLPSAALQKVGAFRLLARRFSLKKLAPNTHVYTSDNPVSGFPGRTLRVIAQVRPDHAAVKEYFHNGFALAVSRNHPLTAEQLLKKCKLKQGGNRYLIALRGTRSNFVLVAESLLT